MKFISDFHIHSKYSRATSKSLDLEHIEFWCKLKGIDLVAVPDFTHPQWFKEVSQKLIETEPGIYQLRHDIKKIDSMDSIGEKFEIEKPVRFIFSTELSCIYKKNDRVRKIHIVFMMPSMDSANRFRTRLGAIANLAYDGRPILGLDAAELARIAFETDPNAVVIPAHIWTPWFSLFGSKSGFDTIQECFDDLTSYIRTFETGLSSDPSMNRRLKQLDDFVLVSHSDAHSLENLGREANIFNLDEISYNAVREVLLGNNKKGFPSTIEFYPEEGKYHLDGHAPCELRLMPRETKKYDGICPSCGKKITIGVLHRVEDLADRPQPDVASSKTPFTSIVPLHEIIAECYGVGKKSKKVTLAYAKALKSLGNEFHILIDASIEQLMTCLDPKIVNGIKNMRIGNVQKIGGYDGVYGTIRVCDAKTHKQTRLF